MSAGNINVSLNDGLLYVHYDAINVYRHKKNKTTAQRKDMPKGQETEYKFDRNLSQAFYDLWLKNFKEQLIKKYPSFKSIDKYSKRNQRLILENSMFFVAIEDNVWGFAVELIGKDKYPYPTLQAHLFLVFFKGIKDALFNLTDTIYIRSGSWMAKPITKDTTDKIDEHINAARIKLDPKVKATGGYDNTMQAKEGIRDANTQ